MVEPTVTASSTPPTHRFFVAVVTNFPGTAPTSASALAEAQQVADYWKEQSSGHINSFTIGNGGVALRFATAHTDLTNCGLDDAGFFPLTDEARTKFASKGITDADTILVMVPGSCRGAPGNVVGRGGGNAIVSADDNPVGVIAHEEGHVLDLMHANTANCDVTCSLSQEYGDWTSVMGPSLGSAVNTLTPLNAAFREWLGWTSPGEQQQLVLPDSQTSATTHVTLAPRSASTGLRSVRIPDPDSDGAFYLEYRDPQGRDLNSIIQHPEYAGGRYSPGGVSLLYRTNNGIRPVRAASFLEFTPAFEAFRAPGASYTSHDGTVQVDVLSADASGATLDVTVSSPKPQFTSAPTPTMGGPVQPFQVASSGLSAASFSPAADQVLYQWYLDGEPVTDGFGWDADYYPQAEDVGKQLSVQVTARKAGYRVARRTSTPVVVAWMTPQTPVLTGTPEVGITLRVNPGAWGQGVTFGYRWFAGTTLVGSDNNFLVLTSTMAGKQVHVEVTGSLEGQSETRSSALTEPVTVGWAPKTPTFPAPHVGQALTVATGDWGTGVAFTYRWYVGTTAITGATGKTYTPTASKLGKSLWVKVTGSKAGHPTTSKSSVKQVVAKGVLVWAVPTISGTPKVGQTLTANHGTWTTGTTFHYQWLSNGVAITNATASTYKLPSTKVGKNIKVKVTGTKTAYTTVSKISAAVGPVVR